ncbi:MAG: FKBP-type peptidyl-prolyl cis-trans isomerase [Propionibacteriaceae bacterium]|nr:FKBP-type peptidyl-prolyl cis-trans isomerase [Propionibacteriaceae bacterium]
MNLKRLTVGTGLGLAFGLVLGLAGCGGPSSDPSTSPSATETALIDPSATALPTDPSATPTADEPTSEPIPVSTNLDAITVGGGPGEAPTVTVPAPWAIDRTQTRVLDPGDGDVVPETGLIKVDYYGVNGRTGESFDDSYSRGAPADFLVDGVVVGFQRGLVGQRVGSRVLIGMPGSDGYDPNGGNANAGIEVGDSLIFVAEILEVALSGPRGAAVQPAAGLPEVSGETEHPVVTVPSGLSAPSELKLQVLTEGAGPAIGESSLIEVDYAEYTWAGRLARQTYGFSPVRGYLSSAIPGWQDALVGVKQGSRVLLIVPSDLAYPKGNKQIDVKAGETMVFLIDVLYA